MACAWGGSTAGFGEFITGEKLGWWKIGYNLNDQRPIINSITAYFDLMPKEIFSKETQWGKEIVDFKLCKLTLLFFFKKKERKSAKGS